MRFVGLLRNGGFRAGVRVFSPVVFALISGRLRAVFDFRFRLRRAVFDFSFLLVAVIFGSFPLL